MAQGVQLSVPGKTFVVGEYLALKGGPSILACTEPRFVLNLFPKKTKSETQNLFNQQSPAGKFLKDHQNFFSHWQMEFHDPYQGRGGFGASTAQFAMLYMAELIMREGELSSDDLQWSELLRDYHLYAYSGVGEPPSGADLIAQLTGGMVLYDGQKLDVQTVQWPFKDLGFLLIHTGEKLATHKHLETKLDIPVESLRLLSQKTTESLSGGRADEFTSSMQGYGNCLDQHGFLTATSKQKIEWLKRKDGGRAIISVKACGAMGSDVLLMVYRKQDGFKCAEDWRSWLKSQSNVPDLELIASDENLSAGLRVEEIESAKEQQ